MKRLMILIILFSTIMITHSNAQKIETVEVKEKDKVQVSLGFFLVPSASISLKNLKPLFRQSSSLSPVVLINKGKWTYIPQYSILNNAVGFSVVYKPLDNFGTYLFTTKNLLNSGSYAGLGVFRPVANGRASAFLEIGNPYNTWDPGLYFGVFIPFLFNVGKGK